MSKHTKKQSVDMSNADYLSVALAEKHLDDRESGTGNEAPRARRACRIDDPMIV